MKEMGNIEKHVKPAISESQPCEAGNRNVPKKTHEDRGIQLGWKPSFFLKRGDFVKHNAISAS